MRIELQTHELDRRDAVSLVAMMFAMFPDLGNDMGQLADIATGRIEISGDVVLGDAERAFAPPAAAPPAPSAAEAFAAPTGAPTGDMTGNGSAAPDAGTAAASDGSTATATLAPAAASAGGSIELDSAGLPWDTRLHSENKTKNDNGTWRGRRGVSPSVRSSVIAELRKTYPEPAAGSPQTGAAAPAAPTPPPAAAPVATQADAGNAPAPAAAAGAPSSDLVAPAPSAAPAPLAPAPDASPAPAPDAGTQSGGGATPQAEFARVMRKVTEAQTAGRIKPEETTSAAQAVGVGMLAELISRPDLIPAFEATFDAMLAPAAA